MLAADRAQALVLIEEACAAGARKRPACAVLDITLRTMERWQQEGGLQDKRQYATRVPHNKLSEEERKRVLTTVNSERYRDLPVSKIVPLLADEQTYLASESTFYRVLRAEDQLTHRQKSKPARHSKPKAYVAGQANQVWSWDISYLPTQVQGLYFYLYLIVDIFSRKIVGWSVHEAESSEYASGLVSQACIDEKVGREQLVLHSDNGAPMKGATLRATLERLGVTPSFSRPSVSDDNPYSESLFRTLKYQESYPCSRFKTLTEARQWCEQFTCWYNTKHLHSGLKFITPQQRHTGEDKAILAQRKSVYEEAKKQNPARWSGSTRNWELPNVLTLNPNKKLKEESRVLTQVA